MAMAADNLLDQLTRLKERRAAMPAVRRPPARKKAKEYRPKAMTWMGIDGEGWDVDQHGRQCYKLMAAATDTGFKATLIADDTRLSTLEIFDWLSRLDGQYRQWCKKMPDVTYHPIRLCGYGFGYDYAHFLIDVADEDIQLIKDIYASQDFQSPMVRWPVEPGPGWAQYGIKRTAGKLSVHVYGPVPGGAYTRRLRGFTVWDVIKFFQSSFLVAAKKYMTAEELKLIEAGKERRNDDEHDIDLECSYSLAECRVLARLMTQFASDLGDIGLQPKFWFGPGTLAAMAMEKFNVRDCFVTDSELDPRLVRSARIAYIGGRFETTGHGRLRQLMQYDINSAYPYAVSKLPCLAHSTWEHFEGGVIDNPYALYKIKWSSHGDLKGGWGPWPMRNNINKTNLEQVLPTWSWSGESWVWGCEALAGLRLLEHSPKARVTVLESWVPTTRCDDEPFSWIGEWYRERQRLKAAGDPRQMGYKLILNSMYGKLAQSVGSGTWRSFLWAGWITAHARSQLLDAICESPESVVMVATDAVYSVDPLHLECGDGLGEWEVDYLSNVLIIQSGFHTSMHMTDAMERESSPKTRGMPQRYIDWSKFQDMWDQVLRGTVDWKDASVMIDTNPETGEKIKIHIGIGLAQQWGMPEKLGMWLDWPHEIKFRTDKRPELWKAPVHLFKPDWIYTRPVSLRGDASASYRPSTDQGDSRLLVFDQPNSHEWGVTE